MKRILIFAVAVVALALAVAAVRVATSSSSPATVTVAARQIPGVGKVLVDGSGLALYASDQETGGMARCTGACNSFWKPLTVYQGVARRTVDRGHAGSRHTSGGDQAGHLQRQAPLYLQPRQVRQGRRRRLQGRLRRSEVHLARRARYRDRLIRRRAEHRHRQCQSWLLGARRSHASLSGDDEVDRRTKPNTA